MSKPIKRIDVSKLTAEQRAALGQLIRDAKTVAPQMAEFQKNARTIFEQFVRSPQWTLRDGPQPEGEVPDQNWHAKPQIRYVDEIESWPRDV